MLHQGRLANLLLLIVLLLNIPTWAEEALHCVICAKTVTHGYRIEDAVYCADHWRQTLPQCVNCGSEITGDYNIVGMAAQPVCPACTRAHSPCFLCGAPADPDRGGAKLADGRALCGLDRKSAVFSAEQAVQLFTQAATETQRALGASMVLKVPVKAVRLVDVPGLIVASKGGYEMATLMSGRVLGLTTLILKSKGQRRWTEPATVHLLQGVPQERMLTVCAHEYAHVWHAENHRNYASTSSEMREGFAEWVAYKVSQHSRRQMQVAVLDYPTSGLYYEGLKKYLKLEGQVGVSGVLEHALTATGI